MNPIKTFLILVLLATSTALYSSMPDWMWQNRDNLGDIPLSQLVIPGTHDSATALINNHSANSSDIDDSISWLRDVKKFISHHKILKKMYDKMINKVIADWSKTQPSSINEQLENGIRYLDIRVCYRYLNEEDALYTCHGSRSTKIEDLFKEISAFSEKHPHEVILLHFQHFHDMDNTAKSLMYSLMNQYLADKMVPKTHKPTVTLNELWKTPRRLIVMYNSEGKLYTDNALNQLLWSTSEIQNPWGEKQSVSALEEFLVKELRARNQSGSGKNKFYVLQSILSPNKEMIIKGILDILEPHRMKSVKDLAHKVNPEIIDCIKNGLLKGLQQNIIMMDWVNDDSITKLALELNKKQVQR